MNFFTVVRYNPKWNYLSTIVENPKIKYSKKTLSSHELLIRGNSAFAELNKVSLRSFDSNPCKLEDITLFICLQNKEIRIPFKSINCKVLQNEIVKAGNNFEQQIVRHINWSIGNGISLQKTRIDVVRYCNDYVKMIHQNFEYYHQSSELIEVNFLPMLGYLYFITEISKKDTWNYIRFLNANCYLIHRMYSCCSFCNNTSPLKRKKCSGCKTNKVFYCSVECQKKHWKVHIHNCESKQKKQNKQNEIDEVD
jgi:hypothetical protein